MAAKEYSQLVQETTGWRGAYPLVLPIKVGDYFQIGANDLPVGLGNVLNWPGWADRLPVDSEDIAGSETYSAGCQRESGATASAGATSPTGLGAEATLAVSFSHSAGFLLAHTAAKHWRFRDVAAAQRAVLELARQGDFWKENWILATEVVEAESATLVVSTEANSSFELHASMTLPPGLAAVGIADPRLGWTASGWRGSGYSSVCKPGTPLYHCVRARRSFWGTWKTELLDDAEVDLDTAFTDNPYDDRGDIG